MNDTQRQAFKSAALLAAFAVTGSALLALANEATRDRIAENERLETVRQLQQILPAGSYDNALLEDTLEMTLPADISRPGPDTIHLARRGDTVVAAILPVTAPNGYSGAIDLLLGVRRDGTIAAARVTRHRETPGLGDGIDLERSDWIRQFADRSLNNPLRWAVDKDDGPFDSLTGATITPRAVVQAIHGALQFVAAHRKEIFGDGRL